MSPYANSSEHILQRIEDGKIQSVTLWFTSLRGSHVEIAIPPNLLEAKSFVEGVEVSGCPFRPDDDVNGSCLAVPDAESGFIDPFSILPTLILVCSIRSHSTPPGFDHDVRRIAQKAEIYLATTDVGDIAKFGFRLIFAFIDTAFDRDATPPGPHAETDLSDASSRHRAKVRLADLLPEARTRITTALKQVGKKVVYYSDEISGSEELDARFTKLTEAADGLIICHYVIERIAREYGLKATFMSANQKPARVYIRQDIWYDGRSLFVGQGYAETSALMRHYMAGLVHHAPALMTICAPQPVRLNAENKAVRVSGDFEGSTADCVPFYSSGAKGKYIEYGAFPPSFNPYLAFAAMLMAGIDGFQHRLYALDPDAPIKTLLSQTRQMAVVSASDALLADHEFLLKGGVFTTEVIKSIHQECAADVKAAHF